MKIYVFLLALLTLIYSNESKLNISDEELKELEDYIGKVKKDDCVNGVGYFRCKNAKYPKKIINKIIKQYKETIPLSGNIVEYYEPPKVHTDNATMENLCQVKEIKYFPRHFKNIHDEPRIIINVDGYDQGIKFEECVKPGKQCIDKEHLPFGTIAKCVQQYSKIRMIVVDIAGNSLVQDYFQVPSGCCCKKRVM